MPQLVRSIIENMEVVSPGGTCPCSAGRLLEELVEDTDLVVYLPPGILAADLSALIGNCSPDEFSDGLKLRARFVF